MTHNWFHVTIHLETASVLSFYKSSDYIQKAIQAVFEGGISEYYQGVTHAQ